MSYVENNKYRFPGKKKMEYVPSKIFPLSSKKVHWFGHPNTSKFELTEKQNDIINSLNFDKGRCYTNTEKLINAFEGELDLKFFSGWVFLGYWQAVGGDPTTHPSYSGMGLDEKGSSRTQRELGLD
jgi:hypothetical protein